MIKKSVIVLALLFFTQFLFSCFPCKCPKPETYEINYKDLSVTAYNTSGFQDKMVDDTVHRNSFGLGVSVNFDLVQLAASSSPTTNYGFGFATATSCDCNPDDYRYPDPLDYLEIYVTDMEAKTTKEITDYFAAFAYSNGGLISLDEFFNNKEDWHDGFQLQLVEYDEIPKASVFRVDAYLKSGKKFTRQTEQINFF